MRRRGTTRPAVVFLFLWVVLLAGRQAAAQQPIEAELCTIVAAPQQFSDRPLRVHGNVVVGFELFALGSPACEDRLWLDISDGNSAAKVGDGGGCRGRVVPDVSPARFLEWGRSGLLKTPGALPWRVVAPAPPVNRVRNKTWRRFVERARELRPLTPEAVCIDCPRYAVTATLLGVLEYQPAGCVTQAPDGALLYQPGGFGPQNQYPARLVVGEVLDFSAVPVAPARP
jgi:hypothetical protein